MLFQAALIIISLPGHIYWIIFFRKTKQKTIELPYDFVPEKFKNIPLELITRGPGH